MMDTKSRYEELKQQIHFHNYRYHVLDAPVISDLEFDKLLNELKRIEADHPDWVTSDSPTLRAGAKPADRFNKVTHPAPILSLANAFGAGDMPADIHQVFLHAYDFPLYQRFNPGNELSDCQDFRSTSIFPCHPEN